MAEGLVLKNKLRIVRRVGRGGMGHVYEVYHEVLRVRRALKQIVSDLQDNPEIERRFLHEAQMMARLEHPHIVKVFDIDQEPGFGTYLLMEFIQGRDLGTILRERGRFSLEDTVRIGIAVASALDCAHSAGLVHRDIKPANILIEEGTGRPVVTDFGIAKEVEGAVDEGFTKTGSFIGTYRYSSREQIRAEKDVRIDGRADVYSLGVVLYEISSGHRYLEGMPELKIASCVGYQDNWRPPLEFPDDLPESFRKLIEHSIEPNREQRVGSARALMVALEECLGGASVSRWSPSSPPPRGQAPPLAATRTGAGGGAALQELTEAPTALEDDSSDTGVTEERARDRARLVVRLQSLRKAVDGQSGEFERLLKTLQEFDLPRDEFRQLDDMSQILHRVEESEQEGALDAAIASLEGLSDRLQRNSARMEVNIVEAIERSRDEIRQSWRRLVDLGPEWLDRGRSEDVERRLAGLAGALAGHRWEECRQELNEAGSQVEGAWRAARERAARRVESGLATLFERYATLRNAAPEDLAASGIDPEALSGRLAALLERGELRRASEAIETALATLERILAEVAQREAAALAAARERADTALAALPRGSAERLAPDELARVDQAHTAAESAARAGDRRAAARAFDDAVSLATRLARTVAGALAAERTAAETALRELLANARTADESVVGAACEAAAAALRLPPGADESAIAGLEAARHALAGALLEAEQATVARAAEADALAALARVRELSPTAEELAPGEGRIAAGRTAAAKRDWRAATDRYAEAVTALGGLAREIAERRERDDLEAARRAAESLFEALPRASASALATAPLAAAERLLADARRAAERGDRGAAKAAFSSAAERLGVVRDALATHLVDSTGALTKRWEDLEPRLGGLIEEPDRAAIEAAIDEARRSTEELRLGAAEGALGRLEQALASLQQGAEARARARLAAALESLEGSAARLGAAAPSQSLPLDGRAAAVGPRAEALLGEGRTAAAVALAEEAATLASRTVADRLARLEGECAEQQSLLARIREELGRRTVAAAAVAPAESAQVASHESTARQCQAAGRLEAALEAWRAATLALGRVREVVDEAERARVVEACDGLAALIELSHGAAPAIVGEACDAASKAIATARDIAPGQAASALATLSEAHKRLENALREAGEQAEAAKARAEADVARERAVSLVPKRRSLKPGERLLRDATKAFERQHWQEARSGYLQASEAFSRLAAEMAAAATAAARETATGDATQIATPGAKPPVTALAAAAFALVLVVGGWLWWQQATAPGPTGGPQQEARVEPKREPPAPAVREEPAKMPVVVKGAEPVPTAAIDPAPLEQVPGETAAVEPSPPGDLAKAEPPAPAPPPRPRIASFAPTSAAVRVAEGSRQTFRIALAGVPPGTSPTIEWQLGDEVMARDVPEFTLAPDFDAATKQGEPITLVARVAGAEGPSQRWEVEIADVNRAPTLAATTPATNRPIEAEVGTKVVLNATVNDLDRDDLVYSWKVDGKPVAGDGSRLEVPVSADGKVELTVSDGAESVRAEWRIAAIQSPFRLDTRPASLSRLAFASAQEFRAEIPRGLAADKIDLEWTVDGRRAGTGTTFRFANDDPARVRKEPVKVALRATDASGRSFTRDWSFVVTPPVPRLSRTEPRPGEIGLARGGEQVFVIDAAPPVGAQALEYVFEVDGRRIASGSDPQLRYRQPDDRPHTIVAYARDNFDQVSAKQRWTIKPAPSAADIVARAREWLTQYRDAFNQRDARRIGELRGLGPDAVSKLSEALSDQEGLQVEFANVRVEKLDDNRARIRYDRTDRFTEARGGRPVERTGSVEQVVGVVGGRLQEIETRRR